MLQHRGPEQRVEIQDVLADEVVQLGIGALLPVVIEVDASLCAELFEAAHVADGRIQPHVEILARRIGDLKAEIRRVARDVPVGKFVLTFRTQPLLHLVRCFILQRTATRPFAQELLAGVSR